MKPTEYKIVAHYKRFLYIAKALKIFKKSKKSRILIPQLCKRDLGDRLAAQWDNQSLLTLTIWSYVLTEIFWPPVMLYFYCRVRNDISSKFGNQLSCVVTRDVLSVIRTASCDTITQFRMICRVAGSAG